MSRNIEVQFEIDAEIEINCSITPFVRGNSPMHYYGPTPDEPSEVEDLVVCVTVGGESIDITELLTKKALKEIESQCFEAASDREQDQREAAAEARYESMREEREERKAGRNSG